MPAISLPCRQCTVKRSLSASTVIVPGVSVMELASMNRANSVRSGTRTVTSTGSMARFPRSSIPITAQLALRISQISTPR